MFARENNANIFTFFGLSLPSLLLGHYSSSVIIMINRQLHAFECNLGIIALKMAKLHEAKPSAIT